MKDPINEEGTVDQILFDEQIRANTEAILRIPAEEQAKKNRKDGGK